MTGALQEKESAYIYGLQKMSGERPKEAFLLLQKIFERGDLKTKLISFRTVIFSDHLGDGKSIGDFFVKIMETSSPDEQEEIIEPFLQSILNRTEPTSSTINQKLSWLHAVYHGWKEEQNFLN